MQPIELFILRVSLMAIPLYICNGLALVFGGKTPVDLGKKFFDNRPILGSGKTFRGSIAGIAFATASVYGLAAVFPETSDILGVSYFSYGFLLALGAVLGDFAGSFIKRRMSIVQGKSVFLLDQLDFVAGGFLVSALLVPAAIIEIVFLLAFTLLAHVIGNWVAFFSKMKRNPW